MIEISPGFQRGDNIIYRVVDVTDKRNINIFPDANSNIYSDLISMISSETQTHLKYRKTIVYARSTLA